MVFDDSVNHVLETVNGPSEPLDDEEVEMMWERPMEDFMHVPHVEEPSTSTCTQVPRMKRNIQVRLSGDSDAEDCVPKRKKEKERRQIEDSDEDSDEDILFKRLYSTGDWILVMYDKLPYVGCVQSWDATLGYQVKTMAGNEKSTNSFTWSSWEIFYTE